MSDDDVLFGYRLRVFDYGGTSVSEASRTFGIHRPPSTYGSAA
jgi:hypothetical protein